MCNCIEETNKILKEEHPEWNTELDIPFSWDKKGTLSADRVTISTMKIDPDRRPKNKKPARLFATYCPFCGEKYKDEK